LVSPGGQFGNRGTPKTSEELARPAAATSFAFIESGSTHDRKTIFDQIG
jgi:hypothetical protein